MPTFTVSETIEYEVTAMTLAEAREIAENTDVWKQSAACTNREVFENGVEEVA